MKKFTTILFILGFSALTMAQHNRDKINALKIAFITEKLDLSPKEAQQFWPIYNGFQDSYDKLRRQSSTYRKNINFETLSEKEAKDFLKNMTNDENQKHLLNVKFMVDLQQILPAKKIILLKKAEDDFKRKMFDEYKSRRSMNGNPRE
jgi:Spy/CpxP family protein refolding chaperone